MKKNIEKIEKTVVEEKVTYIAIDGTVFKDEENCKEWEEDYKCVISQTFNNMQKIEVDPVYMGVPYSNEDDIAFIVIPKTEQDIITLKYIHDANGFGEMNIDLNWINKKILIRFGYGFSQSIFNTDYVDIFVLDEFMNDIKEAWNNAILKLDGEK